jgi:hypothetical protein
VILKNSLEYIYWLYSQTRHGATNTKREGGGEKTGGVEMQGGGEVGKKKRSRGGGEMGEKVGEEEVKLGSWEGIYCKELSLS